MKITVTLFCSPAPRTVIEQVLILEQGTTASAAVRASRIENRFPALDWQALTPGVWGKSVPWEREMLEGAGYELLPGECQRAPNPRVKALALNP